MTKTRHTEQQIQELTKDWVAGRNAATHVHKDVTGTIMHAVQGGYSSYFAGDMGNYSDMELMRTARIIAQHTVDTMVKRPVKVTLGGDTSRTDGNSIQVSSDYFDEQRTKQEQIDLLIGYAIHEACHINHSDFTGVRCSGEETHTDELRAHIVNILEDERIEYLLGEPLEKGGDGMPGYCDFLGCCKRRTFGKFEQKMNTASSPDEITRFLNALLVAVRFTSELPKAAAEEFYDELSAARKVLTPYPRTFEDVQNAADAIIDILKDMIRRKMQKQKERAENRTRQTVEELAEQLTGGKHGGQGQHGSGGQQQSGNQQGEGSCQQKGRAGEGAGGNGAGGITQKDVDDKLESTLKNGSALTLMDALYTAEQAASSIKAAKINAERFNAAYVDGDGEIGGEGKLNSIIYERRGRAQSYNSSLDTVRSLVPAMTAALRCRTEDTDYVLQGERSGRLNLYKMVQCRMGCPNVYERRGTVTADSACVCLLIDESGSMQGKNISAARDAAVLVSEAVKDLTKVEFFAYGFGGRTFTVYHERGTACRTALGALRANGGTPTGPALRLAAKRIRSLTDRTCLVLVLTDGKPDSECETFAAVKSLQNKGFAVVGVDLTGGKSVMDIFEDAVSVESAQELVPCVRSLVETRMMPLLERRDSGER